MLLPAFVAASSDAIEGEESEGVIRRRVGRDVVWTMVFGDEILA